MPIPEIEPGSRGSVPPEYLHLDGENPRFAAVGMTPDMNELDALRLLADHADLEELVQSIAANSYIGVEPLIVVRRDDHYVVVEGNRRLAAIRILSNAQTAEELGIVVPNVSDDVKDSLAAIDVLAVADRIEARHYIGFKHINGPHKWDSFSKGKFAADWYRLEKDQGTTIRDIARSLGDRHDTVVRLVHGIFVLEEAESKGLFALVDRFSGRAFAFSHLYTALTRPGFREYLGLDPNWRTSEPSPDPVPTEKLGELKEVLIWLYGSKEDDIPPVVTSQNPHIKQLAEVLERPIAAKRLKVTGDLRDAHAEVDTPTRRFTDALVGALQQAERAQQNSYDMTEVDESLIEVARRLQKVSASILRSLTDARSGESDEPAGS